MLLSVPQLRAAELICCCSQLYQSYEINPCAALSAAESERLSLNASGKADYLNFTLAFELPGSQQALVSAVSSYLC